MVYFLSGRLCWRSTLRVLAGVILVLPLASGCASRMYRPTNLPAEFAAAPVVNLDTLNLSNLAGSANTQSVICWGDLLEVEVDAGLPSLEPRVSNVQVGKDGTAKIPLIGLVPVAGLEVEQAEVAIAATAQQRDVYPNPFVSVRIVSPRKNRVTVVGAVTTPGLRSLPRGSSSLMAALVSSGGLANNASGDVEIRHTDPRLAAQPLIQASTAAGDAYPTRLASHDAPPAAGDGVTRINLMNATADSAGDRELSDGDVVNVVSRELPPIHVLGLVNKPGAVEMTSNRAVYLLDALAMAGGCSTQVADRVTIRRQTPGQAEAVTILASIRKAIDGQENLLLAPGDTIMVRQTLATVATDVFKSFVRLSFGSSVALF